MDVVRFSIGTRDDLKGKVVYFWNRIPIELCRSLYNRFNEQIIELQKNGIKQLTKILPKSNGKNH